MPLRYTSSALVSALAYHRKSISTAVGDSTRSSRPYHTIHHYSRWSRRCSHQLQLLSLLWIHSSLLPSNTITQHLYTMACSDTHCSHLAAQVDHCSHSTSSHASPSVDMSGTVCVALPVYEKRTALTRVTGSWETLPYLPGEGPGSLGPAWTRLSVLWNLRCLARVL